MTYQELSYLTSNINFNIIDDAEYTTGNGWTNARWQLQSSFIQFLTNCVDCYMSIRFSEKINMTTYNNHEFSIRDGKVTKTK